METWKAIPGFENLYEASNYGNVRTVEGKVTSSARFEHRIWKQRVLKQKYSTNKYGRKDARVTLWKDRKSYTYLVARLTAMAFYPDADFKLTVNHIDGNSLNNYVSNLEWVTQAKNIQLGFKTGLYDSLKKPIALRRNGEISNYTSYSEASRALGRKSQYISYALKEKLNIYDADGNRYEVIA